MEHHSASNYWRKLRAYVHLATLLTLTGVSICNGNNAVTEEEDVPRIIVGPRDTKVVDNDAASFFCSAVGNPVPDISWKYAGKTRRNYRFYAIATPQGSVLRIDPVRRRDNNKEVECVAKNQIGTAVPATAKLEVYEQGRVPEGFPRFTKTPVLKAVEKGRNTTMECAAEATPQPSITWLKNYVPVDTTDGRHVILPSGSLQILGSLEEDEGKYECVAENSLGMAHSYGANLYVRVRRVPPIFSIPPENTEVAYGGSVSLTCVAIGSPMPQVEWRLGAVLLTPGERARIGKNVLTLTNVRESAVYTCVARSDLGSVEANAEVTVVGPNGEQP